MIKDSRPSLGMVLKGYPRISETFISNEIRLLEEQGFHIHIISMRRPREMFTHDNVKKIQATVDYLPESILLHLPLLVKSNLLLAARSPGLYLKALIFAFRRWNRTHKSATIKHLLQAGLIVRTILPKYEIKHIHAHFAHSPASVAFFASILSGLHFSFTAHAKDIYTSDPRQIAEKIKMARYVVTCTKYNKKYLDGLVKKNGTPIFTVYHGSDLTLFNTSLQPKISISPPFQILTIARLTEKKGLPIVYQALKLLTRMGIDFHHTLIGDGDDRESIKRLMIDPDLEGKTQWLGTQPHDVVLGAFRNSHLFVLGCRMAKNGDRDGIPNVLVESMAMGVPVVATNISGIPELVIDGETGLLVPPENPKAMAKAMQKLLTDEDLRENIIMGGRKHVKDSFDNRIHINKLAGIHNELGLKT